MTSNHVPMCIVHTLVMFFLTCVKILLVFRLGKLTQVIY